MLAHDDFGGSNPQDGGAHDRRRALGMSAKGDSAADLPPSLRGLANATASAQRLIAKTEAATQGGKKGEYQLDHDDIDYKLEKLRQGTEKLENMDKEHIKASINALDDIESGVWAAPFFGAFAAMRLMLLILCGQTVAIISVVFTEGGLAFPAWICFSLAIATIVTGFPTWWEPMTNNHAKLHIITSALAAAVTTIITVLLAEKFEIADSRQRGKVVGLYSGLAVLEFLGCFFAVRAAQQTANVDLYVKARLIEWRNDVEKGVFQRYVAGGRRASGTADAGYGDSADVDSSDGEDDEKRPLMVFKDPALTEINRKIEELSKRNNFLEGTSAGLQDLLNASKKRERDHLEQNLILVAKAQKAEDHCTFVQDKLSIFEKQSKRLAAEALNEQQQRTSQLLSVLQERMEVVENRVLNNVSGSERRIESALDTLSYDSAAPTTSSAPKTRYTQR